MTRLLAILLLVGGCSAARPGGILVDGQRTKDGEVLHFCSDGTICRMGQVCGIDLLWWSCKTGCCEPSSLPEAFRE